MLLKVRFSSNADIVEIECSQQWTVERIKSRIEKLKKIPIDSQTLLSGGVKLENDRTIKSYDISNEATLHVVYSIII